MSGRHKTLEPGRTSVRRSRQADPSDDVKSTWPKQIQELIRADDPCARPAALAAAVPSVLPPLTNVGKRVTRRDRGLRDGRRRH